MVRVSISIDVLEQIAHLETSMMSEFSAANTGTPYRCIQIDPGAMIRFINVRRSSEPPTGIKRASGSRAGSRNNALLAPTLKRGRLPDPGPSLSPPIGRHLASP